MKAVVETENTNESKFTQQTNPTTLASSRICLLSISRDVLSSLLFERLLELLLFIHITGLLEFPPVYIPSCYLCTSLISKLSFMHRLTFQSEYETVFKAKVKSLRTSFARKTFVRYVRAELKGIHTSSTYRVSYLSASTATSDCPISKL